MTTNRTTQQIDTIGSAQLSSVTGGGPVGWLVKGARKFGPTLVNKSVEAAKWTGIPSAIGGAAAWVKHQLDK